MLKDDRRLLHKLTTVVLVKVLVLALLWFVFVRPERVQVGQQDVANALVGPTAPTASTRQAPEPSSAVPKGLPQ